jgi:hypothetical protein
VGLKGNHTPLEMNPTTAKSNPHVAQTDPKMTQNMPNVGPNAGPSWMGPNNSMGRYGVLHQDGDGRCTRMAILWPFRVMLGLYGLRWADVGIMLGPLWFRFGPTYIHIYIHICINVRLRIHIHISFAIDLAILVQNPIASLAQHPIWPHGPI